MSFTKQTLQHITGSIGIIQSKTIDDNDLTDILETLNSIIEIGELISSSDEEIAFYWNEIISDSISVIFDAVSGQYRLSISGLRNILELACHSFYFLDHKIELNLFINENSKADKYVSTLISNHLFFTTSYIKTFCPNIDNLQTKEDSVSSCLNNNYIKLCDVVHGRYQTLTKTDYLKIDYSKELFKKFETAFLNTLSIISVMYILRFNDFTKDSIIALAKKTNVIKL